jgi:hypothetical protein
MSSKFQLVTRDGPCSLMRNGASIILVSRVVEIKLL